MVVSQGDVVWVDFPPPTGSGAGFRRPAVIVQTDALNRSAIATTICVPLTSNLKWADALGNVFLTRRATGLPKDSVANVSLVIAIDKSLVAERVGKLSLTRIRAGDVPPLVDHQGGGLVGSVMVRRQPPRRQRG